MMQSKSIGPDQWAFFLATILGLLVVGGSAREAQATMITLTSSTFSLGYGYQGSAGGSWNTSEVSLTYPSTATRTAAQLSSGSTPPAASNTPTSDGTFTFTPTVSGTNFGSAGPLFTNRVMTNGNNDLTANSRTFGVSLAAAYAGPALPADAYNKQFTLNITRIAVWGMIFNTVSYTRGTGQLFETTGGHNDSSSAVTLVNSNDPFFASQWRHIVWDPNDFTLSGVTTATRTFDVGAAAGYFSTVVTDPNRSYMLDGFDIVGNIVFTYEVPEPASLAGFSFLGVALLRRRSGNR